MLFRHWNVSSTDLATNCGCCCKLDTQWNHVEQSNNVDDGNLRCKLVFTQHTCKDSEQLEGPPLCTLHHSAWHSQLEELFGTLPVEGVRTEQGLHVVLEESPLDDVNVDLLSQKVSHVRHI